MVQRQSYERQKTKEMLLGAVNGNEIGQVIVDGNTIARVSTFKSLGIQVESNLKWNSPSQSHHQTHLTSRRM